VKPQEKTNNMNPPKSNPTCTTCVHWGRRTVGFGCLRITEKRHLHSRCMDMDIRGVVTFRHYAWDGSTENKLK